MQVFYGVKSAFRSGAAFWPPRGPGGAQEASKSLFLCKLRGKFALQEAQEARSIVNHCAFFASSGQFFVKKNTSTSEFLRNLRRNSASEGLSARYGPLSICGAFRYPSWESLKTRKTGLTGGAGVISAYLPLLFFGLDGLGRLCRRALVGSGTRGGRGFGENGVHGRGVKASETGLILTYAKTQKVSRNYQ